MQIHGISIKVILYYSWVNNIEMWHLGHTLDVKWFYIAIKYIKKKNSEIIEQSLM